MPDLPTQPNPVPAQPGSPQGQPGSAMSGQPPIGSSPATQPVANRGMQAAGLAKLSVAVRLLESLLPTFSVGSDVGGAVLDSLKKLSKYVPSGSVSTGVEQSALMNLQNDARQNAARIAAMRAAQMGGGAPGAGVGGPQMPPQIQALMSQQPQGSA